ncbi:hypothetical protein H0H87_010176 [Tephrocybe sp. NHM501043]|nr:hypothetical protein H0H87_010176 [Tephrocybe sp. NHM501043]
MFIIVSSTRSSATRASLFNPRVNSRALHATSAAAKTVTEKVSEVADKGKAGEVSDAAGQKAEEASNVPGEKTKRASNLAGEKVNQAAAGARETKEHLEKKVSK